MRARWILVAAGIIGAAVLAGVAVWAVSGDETRRTAALRSYVSGSWGLFSSGGKEFLGRPKAAECGVVGAAVASETGTNPDPKTIGPPTYEPCRLEVGFAMQPAFYTWLNETMSGKATPRDLLLVGFDTDAKPQVALALDGTLLSGLSLARLDAAESAPVSVEATLAANQIRVVPPAGTLPTTAATKSTISSNFRFAFAGAQIVARKVDGWKFELAAGGEKALSVPKLGHLVVEVPETQSASIQALDKFLQTFLVGGVNDPAAEKDATLSLMSGDLTTEVAKFSFKGVGILGGHLVGSAPAGSSVATREYSLYVENASLSVTQ